MRDIAVGTDLEIVLEGRFDSDVRKHARAITANLARYTDLPMPHAKIKVTRVGDASDGSGAIVEGAIDLAGRHIRAQVATTSPGEGLDLLADVLRHRISCLQQDREARLGLEPTIAPAAWRHRDECRHRPSFRDVPVEERKVVRYKHIELSKVNLDEAIEDLELAGYRFHLFADVESGQVSVVYCCKPNAYCLMTLDRRPVLTEAGAVALMNRTRREFLFYADGETGRGRVIYRRFDGHFGLICASNGGR